jgi:hypothetical protein
MVVIIIRRYNMTKSNESERNEPERELITIKLTQKELDDLLSNRLSRMTSVVNKIRDDQMQYSFIEKVWTEQTGGGVMVDYLRLKSGLLIGISGDCIVNYGKVEDTWDADDNCYDDENVIDLI